MRRDSRTQGSGVGGEVFGADPTTLTADLNASARAARTNSEGETPRARACSTSAAFMPRRSTVRRSRLELAVEAASIARLQYVSTSGAILHIWTPPLKSAERIVLVIDESTDIALIRSAMVSGRGELKLVRIRNNSFSETRKVLDAVLVAAHSAT